MSNNIIIKQAQIANKQISQCHLNK